MLLISFIYAQSSLLAASGKRAYIITANKLSPIELSHLIWTHLHMIVFVYVQSGWEKAEALTGKWVELMNFTAVLHSPFLTALLEKSKLKHFLSVSSGSNSTWRMILSWRQLSDISTRSSLITAYACVLLGLSSWIISVVKAISCQGKMIRLTMMRGTELNCEWQTDQSFFFFFYLSRLDL